MRLSVPFQLFSIFLSAVPSLSTTTFSEASEQAAESFFQRSGDAGHTNNWAVLVSASRYWFNYRHMANALGMYRTVKRLGIPDSNIILMLADDVSCNARNKFPGTVYANPGRLLDLYGENIEVDYRGYEVTVENFIRVLTGRVEDSVPRSKRLLTDERSNVLVYMTGHGGNEFLKFQDNEEISAFDIADAFEQMWQKKRYREVLFMVDTCQANTMYSKLYSPNIVATGSSQMGENSYSHENDDEIGVAVIDSFTHHVLEFFEQINKTSAATLQDLFDTYDFTRIKSHAGSRADLFNRPPSETLLIDFFGGANTKIEVLDAEITPSRVSSSPPSKEHHLSGVPVSRKGSNQTRLPRQTHDSRSMIPPAPPASYLNMRVWGVVLTLALLIGWVGRPVSKPLDKTLKDASCKLK